MPIQVIKRPSVVEGGRADQIIDLIISKIHKQLPRDRIIVVDCTVIENERFQINITVKDLQENILKTPAW